MAQTPRREVILHVADDPADVQRALDAASELAAADPHVDVRIIVNGPALTGVTGDAAIGLPDRTQVAACAVGLGRRSIEPAQLRPDVLTVPSAVAAIVEAQQGGAVYVRM